MKDTSEPVSGSTAAANKTSHSENEKSHLEAATPLEESSDNDGPNLQVFFVTSPPNRTVPIRRHRRPKNRVQLSRQRRNIRRLTGFRNIRS